MSNNPSLERHMPKKTSRKSTVAISEADRRMKRRSQARPTGIKGFFSRTRRRVADLKARRPHRSFRVTRRRDYVSSTGLSGYMAFTHEVLRLVVSNARALGILVAVFSIISIVLAGLASQNIYTEAQSLLSESKGDVFRGTIGAIGEASLLIVSGFAGSASSMTSEQQIYLGFTLLMTWLATVWLMREYSAGVRPRARDAIYWSGAPIIPTMLIVSILAIQLVPVGILSLAYAGLTSAGIVEGGFGAMLFFVITALVMSLVLYWAVSTFFAMIIVTLPGMYPMQAMRAAGDLVVGRRLAIMYRIVWLLLLIGLSWLLVMVPLVMLDGWLKSMWHWYQSIPAVPVLITIASIVSLVWGSSYIYLLYRKLVDHA